MIVWGGYNGNYEQSGGRYNPSNNTWTTVTATDAPLERALHTAVWTGSEMIVWGGVGPMATIFITGGRYSPSSNTWRPDNVSVVNAPSARLRHTAVWTGTEMIIWGGDSPNGALNTGGLYNPISNTWSTVTLDGAATARVYHSAVWTGSEMIIWGGTGFNSDTWTYEPSKSMYLYQKP
jgi:hypothetical protein